MEILKRLMRRMNILPILFIGFFVLILACGSLAAEEAPAAVNAETASEEAPVIDGETASVTDLSTPPASDTDAEDTYGIYVNGISKSASTTSGKGSITLPASVSPTSLYVRVTWVYTLADGSSAAICEIRPVASDQSFDMTGPKAPSGATLNTVQFALVSDANAAQSGAYSALKLDKMN